MDPFENQKQKVTHPPVPGKSFPDFNPMWIPQFDEGVSSKTAKGLERGSDTIKKGLGFSMNCLGLLALIIFLPPIFKFLYELSAWLFNGIEKIFP